VQGGVDRRAGRELPARQPAHHLLERERVVAEIARDRLDVAERRLGRLVVALDRGRLPEPGHVAVPDLDLDHLGRVLRPARDREGLRQLERDDPGAQFHAGTLPERIRPRCARA
jgi:hypothetical protein